ncbi:unnamed protein product [Spirodela intermedia]|uniref:Aspartate/homoserine dehydrogenase NAD-binding domain-containing protein n=1 Tax=Spirodela intermedia TaxID=51605 RepID=A0A7I8IC78_SPIIN|nr:unnamed protein product [Spirodela intermedia]CAA6654491.1 unnamed protein product [Spirodela intermedia]
MKRIPVVIAGCGGVGRQLLEHIVNCRALHSKQGLVLRVVGVCDSQSMLVANDIFTEELNDDVLARICLEKSRGTSLSELNDIGDCQVFDYKEATMQVIDIAGLLGRSTGLAVVDCTASSETLEVLKQVIDSGCCVVLANKKPLTSSMEDYQKLTSHIRRIRYESTVGAGLPIIASVTRVVASGDSVVSYCWELKWHFGVYVMSEVETGKPFSEVVSGSKAPCGMDVARKDFLGGGLSLVDKDIAERVRVASLKGNVLRYVFGSQEISKASSIGRLRGSDNVVEIYSRCYKEYPFVIQGAGAGTTLQPLEFWLIS